MYPFEPIDLTTAKGRDTVRSYLVAAQKCLDEAFDLVSKPDPGPEPIDVLIALGSARVLLGFTIKRVQGVV